MINEEEYPKLHKAIEDNIKMREGFLSNAIQAKVLCEFLPEEIKDRGGFCPLCEGNEDKTPPAVFAIRKNGSPPNSIGWTLGTVPNKFPALRVKGDREGEGLYDKMNGVVPMRSSSKRPSMMKPYPRFPTKRA